MSTYSANMHAHIVEHSPDESIEHSSSYADAEPKYPEGYVNRHRRRNHLSAAAALQRSLVRADVRLWQLSLLPSWHLRHTSRPQLGSQLYYLYPLQLKCNIKY